MLSLSDHARSVNEVKIEVIEKMKRKQFLKKVVLVGVISPILAACGDTNTPTSNNNPSIVITPTPPSTTAAISPTTAPLSTAAQTTEVTTTLPASPVATTAVASNNAEPIVLHFNEFYASQTTGIDPKLSQKLLSAKDKQIKLTGYMAPPLKPALDFFVLTRIRLSVCPFCSTSSDWPEDIVLVTMPSGKTFAQTEDPITVIGRLEIGDAVDPQTGFFSLLRLRAETVEVFRGA